MVRPCFRLVAFLLIVVMLIGVFSSAFSLGGFVRGGMQGCVFVGCGVCFLGDERDRFDEDFIGVFFSIAGGDLQRFFVYRP